MLTRKVTTSEKLINLEADNLVNASGKSSQAEIQTYTNYFELLSQIDQRLRDEDSEYKNKYYPEKNLGKGKL